MRQLCLLLVLALAATAEARMPVRIPELTLTPLTWEMDVDQAKAVLDAAKMSPTDGTIRRYLAMDAEHPYVRHADEPGWAFSPRKNWHAIALFAWDTTTNTFHLSRITEWADNLSPGALKDELAALDATYGRPQTSTANQRTWRRASTQLVASWGDGSLRVYLTRD